jgi:hypothetical protein
MSDVLVATLIHGLNYHVDGRLYTQGFPQVVNEKEALKLNGALHQTQTIMHGQRVAFRRFIIQKMDKKTADLVLEKYGEKPAEKEDEKFLIQDAAVGDLPEDLSMDDLESFEAELYRPEPEVKKSPGRPRKETEA